MFVLLEEMLCITAGIRIVPCWTSPKHYRSRKEIDGPQDDFILQPYCLRWGILDFKGGGLITHQMISEYFRWTCFVFFKYLLLSFYLQGKNFWKEWAGVLMCQTRQQIQKESPTILAQHVVRHWSDAATLLVPLLPSMYSPLRYFSSGWHWWTRLIEQQTT